MKIAQGKVVRGAIVTRARFPEGARVTVVAHDDRRPVKLTTEEEADVIAGLEDIAAGRTIPASRIRAKLRRR